MLSGTEQKTCCSSSLTFLVLFIEDLLCSHQHLSENLQLPSKNDLHLFVPWTSLRWAITLLIEGNELPHWKQIHNPSFASSWLKKHSEPNWQFGKFQHGLYVVCTSFLCLHNLVLFENCFSQRLHLIILGLFGLISTSM